VCVPFNDVKYTQRLRCVTSSDAFTKWATHSHKWQMNIIHSFGHFDVIITQGKGINNVLLLRFSSALMLLGGWQEGHPTCKK